MALIDSVLAWSKQDLKPWQQDAIRRLFLQSLDISAIEELYAMLKVSHGIDVTLLNQPEPLTQSHLPTTASKAASVKLLSIRDVRHVNLLAPSQTLKFSSDGITIIYGNNGAGKSGYARILKKACRSRDLSEDVRPNAMDASSAGKVPAAIFDIELAGLSSSVNWSKNALPPSELSTIAVFDTHCARAYLDQQQEIAYLPFGLDVVENLAQVVLPKILEMLSSEINAVSIDKSPFNHLLGNSKVGQLINALNEKTSIEDIKELAVLSAEELLRLKELNVTLNENDPETKAKELRQAVGRLSGLISKVEKAYEWVKTETISKFKELDQETELAIKAESEAASVLQATDNLLPGTGQELWKLLFNSARNFSNQVAYTSHEYPHTGDSSKCVLCQQELAESAFSRLERFNEYIQNDIATSAALKRQELQIVIDKYKALTMSFDFETLVEELNGFDVSIVEELKNYEVSLIARRDWLLNAQQSKAWDSQPSLSSDPIAKLKARCDKLNLDAQTYDSATDVELRKPLKLELDELTARANLHPVIDSVIALIERMILKAKLINCKKDLATKPISDKAKEFASATVTKPLRIALAKEFEALGVSGRIPRLDESVEKGKMKHRLQLELVHQAQIKDILSEGEQRAIAIGSFLAELETGGHEGGIVFDDPVSSLDHYRRLRVARRLVEESKKRQVVIFTHDTSFLGELLDLISELGVNSTIHYLQWEGQHTGKVIDGLPWAHQTLKERIDNLKRNQIVLARSWPAYPDEEESGRMRRQYNLLRATIERLIQDLVFNGVVLRYRDWIKVTNLRGVLGFASTECDEIERLHKKCCDVVDAHDPSSGKNSPVPNTIDLAKDIDDLEKVAEAIKLRRKNTI